MKVLTVKSKKLFFVVRIVVYCLKIIGLAPFSMPIKSSIKITTRNTHLQVFQSSKVGLVYNILLLIPILLAAAFEVPSAFGNKNTEYAVSDEVALVIIKAEIAVRIFTVFVIVIFWGIRQNNAASIMNRLLEIDLELSSFEKQPFNIRTLIFLIIHIILNTCLWSYVLYTLTTNFVIAFAYLRFVLLTLPNCIIYWFIMEYSTVVGLVANDIETVNKYLLNFKEFGNFISSPLSTSDRLSIIPTHCNSRELAFRKLNKYRDIRIRLVELCDDIGDFFSMPILCCIACCFIPLFYNLYHLFRIAHAVDVSQTRAAIQTSYIVLMFAYPIVSLTLNVTRVGKEAQLTKRIIDKLLEATIRAELMSQLELFSRRLLHENVSFTAYGFFSLDSSILLSMMASTVTYFIALTQFPTGVDKNCNGTASTEQPVLTNRSKS